MRIKYPPIEPYRIGFLDVGFSHRLYFEESGNPQGLPVVFLHGGPGVGANVGHRSYFNPQKYRIIIFDQRGCGRSECNDILQANTTWDLVSDIELLRKHLEIASWVVFGGSWGSFLGLSYAIQYPSSVRALILRGIFLARKTDIDWLCHFGANQVFADEWDKLCSQIDFCESKDLISAFSVKLHSQNEEERTLAAQAWVRWELVNVNLDLDVNFVEQGSLLESSMTLAQIQCHYYSQNSFLPKDNWILENLDKIRHIPCQIVHGRYDMVCPFQAAWSLHKAWPEAGFEIVSLAGHSASEPTMTDALIRATDNFSTMIPS